MTSARASMARQRKAANSRGREGFMEAQCKRRNGREPCVHRAAARYKLRGVSSDLFVLLLLVPTARSKRQLDKEPKNQTRPSFSAAGGLPR